MTRKKPKIPAVTPSMDDKSIPSPPSRTVEQYERDCEAGINPVGRPTYKGGVQ